MAGIPKARMVGKRAGEETSKASIRWYVQLETGSSDQLWKQSNGLIGWLGRQRQRSSYAGARASVPSARIVKRSGRIRTTTQKRQLPWWGCGSKCHYSRPERIRCAVERYGDIRKQARAAGSRRSRSETCTSASSISSQHHRPIDKQSPQTANASGRARTIRTNASEIRWEA